MRKLNLRAYKRRKILSLLKIYVVKVVFSLIKLSILPIIFFIVFLLPDQIKLNFILNTTSPSLLTMYTSSFIHMDIEHLVLNVVVYFISTICLYFLSGRKKYFWFKFMSILLITPVTTGLFTVILLPHSISFGSSNITSAFPGAVISELMILSRDLLSLNLNIPLQCVILILVEIIIYQRYLDPLLVKYLIVILITIIIFIIALVFSPKKKTENMKNKIISLIITSIVTFVFGCIIFSQEIVKESGEKVNLYSHLIGFLTGFFIPLLFLKLNTWRRKRVR